MSSFQVMTPPQSHSNMHSKPQFTSTTSPISPWQPLTPPFTTSDLALAKYTRFARLLQWLRIVISSITLLAAITITACAGIALQTYDTTRRENRLLPLWPVGIDLRDTRAMIAVGVILTVSALGYLGVAFASLKNKTRTLLLISTALFALIDLPLTLFATIFVARVNTIYEGSLSKGTLGSWTCKWQGETGAAGGAPDGFERICDHISGAYDLVVLMCVMVGIEGAVVAGGWLLQFKTGKAEKGRAVSKVELVEGRV